MNTVITTSTENDQLLFSNHNQAFLNVIRSRQTRGEQAYKNFMTEEFTNLPKFLLSELQTIVVRCQSNYDKSGDEKFLNKKQLYQTKIDNNDYCVENSPEWIYRQNYQNKSNQFVWPDSNELVIREEEKTQLLALLNQ